MSPCPHEGGTGLEEEIVFYVKGCVFLYIVPQTYFGIYLLKSLRAKTIKSALF